MIEMSSSEYIQDVPSTQIDPKLNRMDEPSTITIPLREGSDVPKVNESDRMEGLFKNTNSSQVESMAGVEFNLEELPPSSSEAQDYLGSSPTAPPLENISMEGVETIEDDNGSRLSPKRQRTEH
jgi:hypothetical protein